jgi:hypothetical protein
LGVSICLDRESRSRHRQRVRLDIFKKRISTIEKSCLDINAQTKKSQSRSRNSSRSENFGVSWQFVSIEKCVDFCIFLSRFLNPSRLFIIFRLKRLRQCQDFSTNLNCVSRNLDCVSTNLDKNLDYLKKAWLSWFILIVLISLDDLDKNLDASKSRLKNLDLKNLDRDKKKVDLGSFQKLVSTLWTFWISIGLDCQDPQP